MEQALNKIKTSITKKRKLKDIYLYRIFRWAKNKPTSSMSCRTMAQKINSVLEKRNEVDKKGNIISVTYKIINNILKIYYGKHKKIRKVFFLSQKDMEKRFQFCKMIL